jgi:hypothetical protein
MTTKNSPIAQLRFQADIIAKALKLAELGDATMPGPAGSLARSRGKPVVTITVAMDDKTLQITFPWTQIRDTTEAGIAEYIIRQMREEGSGRPQ